MRHRSLWMGVMILLAAAVLRLPGLGWRSVWLDEGYSVWQAEKSQTAIWLTEGDEGHPPLYYSFLHLWLGLGRDETLIRLPSALVSLLGVALIGQLGKRVAGEKVGWTAAAFLAVSPLDVWYAQEARMYTPLMVVGLMWALGLVGTWGNSGNGEKGQWLMVNRQWSMATGKTRSAPPVAAVTLSPLRQAQGKLCHLATLSPCHLVILTFGLYLDFPMVVLWGGLSGVWLAVWWQRGRDPHLLHRWLLVSLGGWLFFLPGLRWLVGFGVALNRYVPLPPLMWLVGLVVGSLGGGMVAAALWPALLKNHRLRQMLLVGIVALFVVLTVWMLLPRLFLVKRLVLLGWPYLVLLLAWVLHEKDLTGFQNLSGLGRSLIAGLWGFSLMITLVMQVAVPKDDWRGVVAFMNDAAAPGDVIWLASGSDPLVYDYYEPIYPARVGSVGMLQDAAATGHRIWLITSPARNPALQTWLETNRVQLVHVPFYRIEVWLYGVVE